MPAILFYDVVVAIHVAAIVIAFGSHFTNPVLFQVAARAQPSSIPALFAGVSVVSQRVVPLFGLVALISGAYLASDRDLWSETWVTVPVVILIVLMGLSSAFFAPRERRLSEISARDLAASGDGPPAFSDEFRQEISAIRPVGFVVYLLILTAIFFMVAKPFA